ncbi:hypothetical protein QBC38DRAFT_369885 [Podospora fimiseda]|uniref:F-box domain-containing protein n=1 Tax=Podospora fimiseda TaxID=252190 RepID=A0AAN7GUZ9_9PEZI|nr:hypothetical protein QBC38DRAFT_369885 [Podospora fimiseda]
MPRAPHLPAEIWLIILSYLPPRFFQQDIGRLLLFKHWYLLSFPHFYSQIEFTPRVISRLVHPWPQGENIEKSRALLKKSLESVNVVIQGIPYIYDKKDPYTRFSTRSNLPTFAHELLEFQKLKHFRFHAGYANQAWKGDPFQSDYLPLRSIEPYLSLLPAHVTSMDIDLCGTNVMDEGRSDEPVHLCPKLRPLLKTLVTLKVRMRSMCRDALRPSSCGPVTVKNLTVNLFLGRVSELNPKLNCSKMCLRESWVQRSWWNAWGDWIDAVDDVREGLLRLVDKMEEPEKVEMVHLDRVSGEVHRWDALSGRKGKCVKIDSEDVFNRFWSLPELKWIGERVSCFGESVTDDTDPELGSDNELVEEGFTDDDMMDPEAVSDNEWVDTDDEF